MPTPYIHGDRPMLNKFEAAILEGKFEKKKFMPSYHIIKKKDRQNNANLLRQYVKKYLG